MSTSNEPNPYQNVIKYSIYTILAIIAIVIIYFVYSATKTFLSPVYDAISSVLGAFDSLVTWISSNMWSVLGIIGGGLGLWLVVSGKPIAWYRSLRDALKPTLENDGAKGNEMVNEIGPQRASDAFKAKVAEVSRQFLEDNGPSLPQSEIDAIQAYQNPYNKLDPEQQEEANDDSGKYMGDGGE